MRTFLRRSITIAAAALGLFAVTGCGGSFQPGRLAGFDADGATQIDDEDIKKAFEARPQMPAKVRVAFFSFDPKVGKDVEASLAKLPGVVSVYRIPGLLVSGQRRLEEEVPWGRPSEVTVKKLRLLAARAHADVLVVVDHGYRTSGANGLAALNILLVPMLFAPFLDNHVEGYAEAFVFDTRNGYLYAHVNEDDARGDRYATIYAKSAHEYQEEQWATLRASLEKDLSKAIVEEQQRSKELRDQKDNKDIKDNKDAKPTPVAARGADKR